MTENIGLLKSSAGPPPSKAQASNVRWQNAAAFWRQCSAAFDILQSIRELSGSNQKLQEISAQVS